MILLIALLATISVLPILIYLDRRNVPPNFDDYCSKIDDELDQQGK
jgi:hypothetical protein